MNKVGKLILACLLCNALVALIVLSVEYFVN